MKYIKQLLVLFVLLNLSNACTEEVTSYALQEVSAPSNINAVFDIAQDDTGSVSVTPTADGVTAFQVYFGDTEAEEATMVAPGESISHVYAEGVFNLRVIALGATGLTSEIIREVSISFAPPSNLTVGTEVSSTNPLEIIVTPTADNAVVYDVYFGDVDDEEATTVMHGENATHIYAEAGDYTIKVIARGAGVATIEETTTITIVSATTLSAEDFIGTWKLALEAGSLGVGPAIGDTSWWSIDAQGLTDRACYFDDTYVFGDSGSFSNVLGADTWVEAWQGGADACGAPVAPHDGSATATYSFDAATSSITISGAGAYLGVAKANNDGELPNVAVPTDITYTVSLSEDKNSMDVVVETGTGSGVFWQYKMVKGDVVVNPPMSVLDGVWVMASEAGSLGVGPAIGDISWWSIDAQGITDRACYYDDTYVFNANGTFSNMLGADSWIENWQGGTDACGAPVAPYDGTAMATYTYNETAGTLTLTGTGAYLGLAKANNDGELPNVAVPSAITYNITLTDDNNTMAVAIESGAGVFWQYKLIKQGTGGGSGGSGGGSGTGEAPYAPIDFETAGYGADWTWSVFENVTNPAVEIVANPDATGINTSATVAKITALQGGQPWVGCETTHGEGIGSFTFDATNSTVKIMVWKSVISDVGIKFAEANGEAQPEVKVANTKINEWEELTFDLSGSIGAGITGVIDQIIIFPDFNLDGRTADNVVYFDNITLGN